MTHPFKDKKRISLIEDKIFSRDSDDSDFLLEAQKICSESQSVLLLSGGDCSSSRYSIVGWQPFLNIESKDSELFIQTPDDEFVSNEYPLDLIDEIFSNLTPDYPLEHLPFQGGAMGYLSYEWKNKIEILPQESDDDLCLPDLFLMFPSRILIHDRKKKEIRLCVFSVDGIDGYITNPEDVPKRESITKSPIGEFTSNTTHEKYIDLVGRIKKYILSGDIYQVNLSHRFSVKFESDPFTLFKRLFERNPSPFYSFINAGDHFIISTSMERFLFQKDSYIETRPIKGTRKRGETEIEDRELRDELITSEKDKAELSMIVDLLRNDLGKVCKSSSVKVVKHREIEAYKNVFHTVSTIAGELLDGISYMDLIRAAFPSGSITGCPKIRAMEIIDELEPNVRHVYTGAIGYFGLHSNLDLSVAIRTAVITDGVCHLGVGGGIVHDSIADDEYEETLHKGMTFFDIIREMGKKS